MIRITIQMHNETIVSLDIKGHAEFDEHGKDLVCASVSSIAFGLLNALDEFKVLFEHRILNNEIYIHLNNQQDATAQIILKTGIIQLETIHESYEAYIKIKKQEV